MSELKTARISPLVRLLVEALDARSHSETYRAGPALIELAQLARVQIPVCGVLPLSNDQLFNAIDAIGIKYLDLTAIRGAVDDRLKLVDSLAARNEIEVSMDHLGAVLNVLYFHAGLAFGITLADLRQLS